MRQGGPVIVMITLLSTLCASLSCALDMNIFEKADRVHDRRAETVRHTDTVFVMPRFETLGDWEPFAAQLRRRILLSSGLLPLPERTPLNPEITGRIEHEEYSVEKVSIEARPGFLVTGNLYRPKGDGPFPGVVCPHGHWGEGRLAHEERGSVPARGITLARMGAVVFMYDMIGYNDSCQFEHGWGGKKEKLWGIHPFAMQLWSSIRAVDFISGLPDVDPDKIGCTGASGGGTQTFALMAVDPRIKAAAPVNMISSTMQGGCGCENAPIIRLENSNMEIGALMAPRPLLMISATGDWTRETPHVEYPAIRSIYRLYDAADRIANVHVDAGHNYNLASREAMYRFFGKWLIGGRDWREFTEPDFEIEKEEHLRVFPDCKLPEGLPSSDEIIAAIIADNRAKWEALLPDNAQEATGFQAQYGTVLTDITGARPPHVNELVPERLSMEGWHKWVMEKWIISRPCEGDRIPAVFFRHTEAEPRDAVLMVHGAGKKAMEDRETLIRGLLEAGKAVLCIDAFLTGEHHLPDKETKRTRKGDFMDTFQPTDTGCRIQDVLTAAAFLRQRRDLTGNISLLGLEDGGLWCLMAAAIDADINAVAADMNGIDPADDNAWVKRFYVPCIQAAGGADTAIALICPRPLVLMRPGGAIAHPQHARIEKDLPDTSALIEILK
jgi:dienelactone hydrolase